MVNLASNLVDTANGHADRVAVRVNETAVTYEDLAQASSRVAGMLRERGVGPGDPVGIMLPNVAEFAVIYYGVLRAGITADELRDHVKSQVAAYKYPRGVDRGRTAQGRDRKDRQTGDRPSGRPGPAMSRAAGPVSKEDNR